GRRTAGAEVLGQGDPPDRPLADQSHDAIALGENATHERIGHVEMALALGHSVWGKVTEPGPRIIRGVSACSSTEKLKRLTDARHGERSGHRDGAAAAGDARLRARRGPARLH